MNQKVEDIIIEIAQGNPGALNVCIQLLKADVTALVLLHKSGLRGPAVWMLYKDECHEDIQQTIKVLAFRYLNAN